jgi:hypothetical protein
MISYNDLLEAKGSKGVSIAQARKPELFQIIEGPGILIYFILSE